MLESEDVLWQRNSRICAQMENVNTFRLFLSTAGSLGVVARAAVQKERKKERQMIHRTVVLTNEMAPIE